MRDEPHEAATGRRTGTVGVVVLADLAPDARLRAFTHLSFGRLALLGVPGLTFAKVLGSGAGGGFRPHPSSTHQGLFCAFKTRAAADAFLARPSTLMTSLRTHARELLTVTLAAYASRGTWSGVAPLAITAAAPGPATPIASLTRASIRPAKALRFWRHAPPSEDALTLADGCLIAAGLGEMPLIRQATFTIWESEAAMARFARDGAHLTAIRAAHADGHFSESLFARFVPLTIDGRWKGRDFAIG